jgi:DNA-binding NarL/FixJ family response regulator
MLLYNGKIWLAMCTVSLSSSNDAGHIVMKNVINGKMHEYSREMKRWVPQPQIVLSEKEKTIIRYATQNLSSTEIGKRFNVSAETVRSQKKNLFKKLHVNSMTEAIIFVTSNDLL